MKEVFKMKRIEFIFIFFILAFFVLPGPCFCGDKTYTGPNNGSWQNGNNWEPKGVPTANDNVTIPQGKTVVSNGEPMKCQDLENKGNIGSDPGKHINISSTGNVTNNGNIIASRGDEENKQGGSVYIDASGNVTNNGHIKAGDGESARTEGGEGGDVAVTAGGSIVNEKGATIEAGDGGWVTGMGSGTAGNGGSIRTNARGKNINNGHMEAGDGGSPNIDAPVAQNGGSGGSIDRRGNPIKDGEGSTCKPGEGCGGVNGGGNGEDGALNDHLRSVMPPAGSRLFCPPVAIAGGRVLGSVIGPDGKALADVNVYITTKEGVVSTVKTGEMGTFELEVPQSEVIDTGLAEGKTLAKMKTVSPAEVKFPPRPPQFVQAGTAFTVSGNYAGCQYVVQRTATKYSLPEARTLSRDGSKAATTMPVDYNIQPGKGKWIMPDKFDEEDISTYDGHVYRVVYAKLDQRRLSSGQKTRAEYKFEFGKDMADQTLWVDILASGPVSILGEKGLRPIRFDEDGEAELEFKVKATAVAPGARIPFVITLDFFESRQVDDN